MLWRSVQRFSGTSFTIMRCAAMGAEQMNAACGGCILVQAKHSVDGCEHYKQNVLYSESTEWFFSWFERSTGKPAQMRAGFAGKTRHTAIQHDGLFRLTHVKTALTSLTGAYEAVNGANTSASRAKHGVCWANATKSIRLTHAKGVRSATRTAQSLIPKRFMDFSRVIHDSPILRQKKRLCRIVHIQKQPPSR